MPINPLLKLAALAGTDEAVRVHIRRGDDVNATDARGRSPLMLAASRGHLDTCKLLLAAGADPDAVDSDGQDALRLAIKSGSIEVAELLRSRIATISGDRGTGDGERSDEDLDAAGWESVVEAPPPAHDGRCLVQAAAIQEALSRHVPVDRDESWTEVEIALPDVEWAIEAPPELDEVDREAVRNLFLDGLRRGVLPRWQVEAVAASIDDEVSRELEALLTLALGDLGVTVEDDGAWQCLTLADDVDDEWQQRVNQAVERFAKDAALDGGDVLGRYERDAAVERRLTKEDEADLWETIEQSFADALSAIAQSPAAIDEILRAAADIDARRLAIGSTVEKERTSDINSFSLDDDGDTWTPGGPFSHLVEALRQMRQGRTAPHELLAVLGDLRLSVTFLRGLREHLGDEAALASLWVSLDEIIEARSRLTRANLGLVIKIARKHRGRGLPFLDLVQEGNVGLIKAVERFHHNLGTKFSRYAMWWIGQSISRVVDQSQPIRIPLHVVELIERVERARRQLDGSGRAAGPESLAEHLSMPLERVVFALDAQRLAEPVEPTASELGEDRPEAIDAMGDPEQHALRSAMEQKIGELLATLSLKEAEVLRLRFGLGGSEEHTLEELGAQFRVTRERIRQIEAKALERLRHRSRQDLLHSIAPSMSPPAELRRLAAPCENRRKGEG